MEFNMNFYIEVLDDSYFRIQELRNARIKAGISQEKMAQYMNISTQKLIRIEKGYNKVFLDDYLLYKKILEEVMKNRLTSDKQI